MEDIFITKIDIEKSRNLENVSISLSETERKHLILTGRNGSGKTSLLREIDYVLDTQAKWVIFRQGIKTEKENKYANLYKKTKISFSEIEGADKIAESISVFFESLRKVVLQTPKGIEKLGIWDQSLNTENRLNHHFLQFLVNRKADRSFAKDDGEYQTVERIDKWFALLENQLKVIFETEELQLHFKRKDYSFDILIPEREPFGFEVLSHGYSSIVAIVAELILRMEKLQKGTLIYDLQGVVLIDEIETHLHVSLQKIILPFLTNLFPKIQFIVSTHSPFILSSISNAIIFDLEHKTVIEDLSQYSYDAIIESYFDSDKYSEIIKEKMEEYDQLSLIENKTPEQVHQFRQLKDYFAHAPKYLAKELFVKLQEIELRSIKSKTVVD